MLKLVRRLIPSRPHTPEMAVDKWGILVPVADLEIPPILAEKPLFLSALQSRVNAMFYGREEDPYAFFIH